MRTRRSFIQLLPVACAGALGAGSALAQPAATMVSETDPMAVSLGYVTDAKRVDKKRFPKYVAGQHCAGCALYGGAPTLPAAPCAIFAGKKVAGPGWCSAFNPKPA